MTAWDELRTEAEAIATGNDVERIPQAVDLLNLLDELSAETERRPAPK